MENSLRRAFEWVGFTDIAKWLLWCALGASSQSVAMQTCYLEAIRELERHSHKNTCELAHINTRTYRETRQTVRFISVDGGWVILYSSPNCDPAGSCKQDKGTENLNMGAAYAGSKYSNCRKRQAAKVSTSEMKLRVSTKCLLQKDRNTHHAYVHSSSALQSVWNADWWVGWANVPGAQPHLSQRSASVQPV